MSILIALFSTVLSPVWAKPVRNVAPNYALHCKMKAVAGPVTARMDQAGHFSLVVDYQGKMFECSLDPVRVKQVPDEPLEPGGKPEGEFRTSVVFSSKMLCNPKDIPKDFEKNLAKDIEWVIHEKSLEFFLENGEPAAPCQVVTYNKKMTKMTLEALKKKLEKKPKT